MNMRRANGEGSLYLRSDGLWTAQYLDSGGRRRYFYSRARNLAEAELHRRSVSREPTVAEWFERWLCTYVRPSVRPRTYAAYHGEVFRQIIPALGTRTLRSLGSTDLQDFLNDLLRTRSDGREGGYSRATVSHVRTRLISALDAAVALGLLDRNPALGLRLPPAETREPAVFTPSEQRRFETAVLRGLDAHPTDASLLVMLGTGLRSGEALALRLCDLDLARRELHVRRTVGRVSMPGDGHAPFRVGEPKTRMSRRTLPLSAPTVALLERYLELRASLVAANERRWRADPSFDSRWLDEGCLFLTRNGGLLDAPNLRRTLAKLERAENLPPVGLHGLRHTFATRWVEHGLDIKTLSELLGHSDAQLTLNVYTHSLPEQKRACVDRLAEMMQ